MNKFDAPLRYTSGYKHQVEDDKYFQTAFRPAQDIHWGFISLLTDGTAIARKGYGWDGMSFFLVMDRKGNLNASLIHDLLYQLMRQCFLDYRDWKLADDEFEKQLRKDKNWELIIFIDVGGVGFAQGKFARPDQVKVIKTAP